MRDLKALAIVQPPKPPPPKPDPAVEAIEAQTKVLVTELKRLEPSGNADVVEAVERLGSGSWVFTVKRDKDGYISSVIAKPLE
jgi:hypothetical protein